MKKRIVLLLSSTLLLTAISACGSNNEQIVENEELKQIKGEITSYIENFDLSVYRESEKTQIQSLFASLQSLAETSNDVDELKTSFNNVKNTISTLKTDAKYKEEEEADAKEKLRIVKEEKIKSVKVDNINQFRETEVTLLNNKIDAIKSEISSLNTLQEVQNYDLSTLDDYKNSLKTNAKYTAEEILTTGIDSKWQLVNDHRDQMVEENGVIKTKEDGYALDSYSYSLNNLDIVFSVDTTSYVNFAGILLVNQGEGDSIDGYAILANRAADHEWYQVYYLENAYGTAANQTYTYLGGWVYTDSYPGGTVTNNDLRVKINGSSLNLYKNDDYLKDGEGALTVGVDLTNNGIYTIAPTYHFGVITWANGGTPLGINLKMISSDTPVNSNNKILDAFNKTYASLDIDNYPEDAKNAINDKKAEVLALNQAEESYYSTVKESISYIKGRIKTAVNEYVDNFDYSIYREAEKALAATWLNDLKTYAATSDYNGIAKKFADVKTKISGLKTDAEYTAEEEEIARNIEAAKINKVKQLVVSNINDYRYEEQIQINNKISEMTAEINALDNVDAVNNYDISPLSTLISSLKTNAEYTMSEILEYGIDSDWDLVNVHRDEMTYDGKNTITTHNDGYALDSTPYTTDGLSMSFSVNLEGYKEFSGALLANKSTSGDGLDGYAILANRAADHEWYQVYYLNNGFSSSPEQTVQYIGGWVYTDAYPGETVTNNMLRVVVENNAMTLYKDSAYQTLGADAPKAVIDLTVNNTVTVAETYSFGILTWAGGGVPYNFELGSLSNKTAINGVEKIKNEYTKLYNSLDLTQYSEEDVQSIAEKKAIIDGLNSTNAEAYSTIRSEIERIKTLKTASYKRGAAIMDAIFSTDNSEDSSWDLVNEHALAWTHVEGTNSVTTPNDQVLAGWRLTKDKYSDIDMTVMIDNAQFNNPYNANISKAFLIGASSEGNYPKGYAVVLFQNGGEAWVQIHYLDGTGVSGFNFKFGVCAWVNNLDVRIVVSGNEFSLWISGVRQQLTNLVTSSETFVMENYNGGSIGILNWDDPTVGSTFTIKDFIGTKIS